MPYVRKPRKTTRKPAKRSSGVTKKRYKRRLGVFRPQRLLTVGFPKTTAVKLRYVDGISLNPVVGSLASYIFSSNSIFDPNYSGVGHYPMNYHTWSALYNHYIVVGAKIKVTFNFGTTVMADGIVYGVNVQDDASYTIDPTTMMEQGLTRYKISNANSFKPRPVTVSAGFSTKKFFNIVNPLDNIQRLGAAFGANPTERAYFVIFVGPTPASTVDLSAVMCTVQIEYICVFSEPKEQPLSA